MSALELRLYLGAARMRVGVAGNLHAANAHLLSKVVVGCLRRYAMPVLELDLTRVREVDHVGISVILDCERCAERKGVLFTLVGAGKLLPRRTPPRQPQTGTVCHPRPH
jgi:ABC-type transporter Mla MlaB component